MLGKKIIIKIDGMHCDHCANRIKSSLEKIDNVKSVKVSLNNKNATIKYKGDIDLDLIKKSIESNEFKYLGVE